MADIVFPGAQPGTTLNLAAMPANQDLVIYKGDYVELLVTITDTQGVAVDLTGAVPKAQLKTSYADQDPIDFTCTATGDPGDVLIFLSSVKSSALVPGDYIWDFQVTISGETRTYLAGDVTVMNEVTT